MHQLLQNPDPPKVDESLLGSRIGYLSKFWLDDEKEEGANKYLLWYGGIVEIVCDGTWIKPGKKRQCYKEGEAAKFWDEIPECNLEASRSIDPFN